MEKLKKMPHGGKRPNSGRKAGGTNKGTLAKREGEARALADLGATAERTKREMATLAYASLGDFCHADGTWKGLHELTPEQAACVQSVEVIRKNVEAGDGKTDTIYKLKLWDKPKALEMLAKHFGLLVEKVEHSGGVDIRWLSDKE